MRSTAKKTLTVFLLILAVAALMTTVASAASLSETVEKYTGLSLDLSPIDTYIDAFKSFSVDILLSGNLGDIFTPIAIVLGVIGLLQCLFGYPLLKIEVFFAGFFAGMFLGELLIGTGIADSFLTDPWMKWVLMAICGLLLAFVAFLLFRASLFFLIALWVFTYARGLAATYITTDIVITDNFVITRNVIAIVVGAVVGLLIAFLAIKLLRTVVILLTAFTGAFTLAFSVGGYIPIDHIQLIIIGVMFVIGVALQYAMSTKKSYY